MQTPAWLTRIGADPRDDESAPEEVATRPARHPGPARLDRLGTCYLAFGSAVGIIPFVYFSVSVGSLLIFARTRQSGPFLTTQLLDILRTTTLGQMFAGGFLPAGGVGLWGILAPLGALVFLEVRQANRWFIGFLCAFVLLGIAGEAFFPNAVRREERSRSRARARWRPGIWSRRDSCWQHCSGHNRRCPKLKWRSRAYTLGSTAVRGLALRLAA